MTIGDYEASWFFDTSPYKPASAYEMFNRDGTSYLYSGDSTAYHPTISVTLHLPKPTRFTSVSFKGAKSANVTISGSTDGTSWTDIGRIVESSVDSDADKSYSATITNKNFFTYIKIEHTNDTISGSIHRKFKLYNNIKIYGTTIDSFSQNAMTITASESNENLSAYETGQIVKLTTPSSFLEGTTLTSTLNIYSLGAKTVPNDMKPSTRYSLVYDGTKFIHE